MKQTPLKRKAPLARSQSPLSRSDGLTRSNPHPGQGNGLQARTSVQRRSISPASRPQRNKVVAEGKCRVCGIPDTVTVIDPAHVCDRSMGGCDSPECTVPLCRAVCHSAYDDGRLDLLPFLRKEEQAHAVLHLGISAAAKRITNDREPVL